MRRLATAVVLALAGAGDALACAVCWGGQSGDPMVHGVKSSILFMAGLTYLLLGGGVAGFVFIQRRARKDTAPGELREAIDEKEC